MMLDDVGIFIVAFMSMAYALDMIEILFRPGLVCRLVSGVLVRSTTVDISRPGIGGWVFSGL